MYSKDFILVYLMLLKQIVLVAIKKILARLVLGVILLK